MNAIESIGIGKSIKYLLFEIYLLVFRIALVPPVRKLMLVIMGAKIGPQTVIFNIKIFNAYHYFLTKLAIGKSCFLGDDVMLDVRGGIILGDNVTVSNRVSLVSHINVGFPSHPLQKYYPTCEKEIVIGTGTYIGTGAIILPGVKIGKQTVIGAGSVVTKDIPNNCVAVGVPAKVIKKLK